MEINTTTHTDPDAAMAARREAIDMAIVTEGVERDQWFRIAHDYTMQAVRLRRELRS